MISSGELVCEHLKKYKTRQIKENAPQSESLLLLSWLARDERCFSDSEDGAVVTERQRTVRGQTVRTQSCPRWLWLQASASALGFPSAVLFRCCLAGLGLGPEKLTEKQDGKTQENKLYKYY